MAKVLLVDDELTMVQMVSEMLRGEGHEVFPFTNSKDAMAGLEAHTPEVVVTDLYLDKTRAHGLDILQKARSMTPPASVIVITAFGSIETAVEAMKNWRLRLPGETVPARRVEPVHPARAELQRGDLREPLPPQAAQEKISVQPDHRHRAEDAGGIQDGRTRGGHGHTILIRGERAARARKWSRAPALQQQAPVRAVHPGELRSVAGEPAGVGIVRPSQRLLHWRGER